MAYNTWIVLLGASALGALAGALGCHLVLRRRALLGDAMAHAALPGLCAAFLVVGERRLDALLFGAFLSALAGAWTVGAIRRHTRVREDAAIGIVLSVFFGLGVAMSGAIQRMSSEGSKAGLDSFVFGKTAGMVRDDVVLIAGVSLFVLAVAALLHKEFKLLAFDRDFAAVQGWPTLRLDMLLLALAAATTIAGLPAVGLALMAAMLIVPAAAARFWTDRLSTMMILAALFGGATGALGTLASAARPGLPTGPVIVLTGTALFLVSMAVAPERGALARLVRRLALARRVADQNLLRTMYELSEPKWPDHATLRPEDLTRVRAWTKPLARLHLHRAVRRGWVVEREGGFRLTADGWRRGAEVVRIHRMWEIFLIEEANVAPALVDRDAERIEHVLPPDLVERLETRLRDLNLIPLALRGAPPRHVAIRGDEERRLGGPGA